MLTNFQSSFADRFNSKFATTKTVNSVLQ